MYAARLSLSGIQESAESPAAFFTRLCARSISHKEAGVSEANLTVLAKSVGTNPFLRKFCIWL